MFVYINWTFAWYGDILATRQYFGELLLFISQGLLFERYLFWGNLNFSNIFCKVHIYKSSVGVIIH